ncbi:MAG: hypothetical protein JOS17DRAFT_765047 [Linnemannia elongata]|nr:MAG: hypothetical protein JOS17DRAFT_765047 [Linnemannia elongata]
MRNSHQKDQLTAKQKSLSIHIDTPLIGPHGMPLIYGSTPNHIGSIRGTVRFSSNYDCKGRDIQIIYEAWSESRWTGNHPSSPLRSTNFICSSSSPSCTDNSTFLSKTKTVMENKKVVQHHSRKVLGYQTWSFPLVHTKSHGSTVVRGNYEQDFEALFIKPSTSNPPTSTTRTSCDSTSSSSPTSSSISTHSHSFNHLRTPPLSCSSSAASIHSTTSTSSTSSRTNTILPSSSTNPNCTVKYTIRAVLTRPFPSLSNVEACQEVWVIHSNGIAPPSNKRAATSSPLPHIEISPAEQQSTSSLDGETTTSTSTTTPFMSTPASKIASDWSSSSSHSSRKVAPMPSTPYGRNQLVVFIYYFCTVVLGLGFCKHYSGVVTPASASSSSTGSSSSSL